MFSRQNDTVNADRMMTVMESPTLGTAPTNLLVDDRSQQQQQQENLFFPWNITINDTSLVLETPQMRNLTSLNLMEQIGHLLNFYYTPFLVTVGSVGNILSVLVFFKTKLRKLSSSYYLAALGISDTCFLFVMFISWLSFFGINVYSRNFFCQFFTYFSSVCCFLSVWFVVAFTVERFIAVLYPLQRQTMCTVRRAKMVICGLIVLSVGFCTPFYLFSEPYHVEHVNATICDVRKEYKDSMKIFNYIDTTVVFVVPFTVIAILNSFIGLTVWKFAGLRRSMTIQRRITSNTRTSRRNVNAQQCTHPNGHNSVLNNNSKIGRKLGNSSQIKVTKMLLIVSTVFVCLNLPSYIFRLRAYILTDKDRDETKTIMAMQNFSYIFFYTNFGINFALYCMSGENFRKAVINMFTSHRSSIQRLHQEATSQVTVSDYVRGAGSQHRKVRRTASTKTTTWTDIK